MKKTKLFLVFFLLFTMGACREKEPEEKPEEDSAIVETPQENAHHHQTKFTLLEKEYVLPFPYEEIQKHGWEANTDLDEILEPGKLIRNKFIRQGPYILRVSFYNMDDRELPLSKTWIAEIASENREFGGDIPSDLELENGINLNTSLEDALKHYDEYEKEESAVYETYRIQHDKSSETTIIYDPKEEKIRWIELSDFHE